MVNTNIARKVVRFLKAGARCAGVVVFAVLITTLNHFFGASFLENFIEEQSLALLGTILAIYIVTASSFLAILSNYEKEKKSRIFKDTTSEIKCNFRFIMVLFVFHFAALSLTPCETDANLLIINILLGAKVSFFALYIYALYELSMVLFNIRDTLNSAEKLNKSDGGD